VVVNRLSETLCAAEVKNAELEYGFNLLAISARLVTVVRRSGE